MSKSITKSDILKRLHSECGLGYAQASQVHDCLIDIIEGGVSGQKKINLGHIGSIVPKVVKGKSVSMNFKRDRTGVTKTQKYFFLDERIRFELRLYRKFQNRVEFTQSS